MAAVFPLDTSQPWTFNGVTYEYDAADDRWFVVSTCPPGQVRTCPNHDFSGPDMTKSGLGRSGHDQIATFY